MTSLSIIQNKQQSEQVSTAVIEKLYRLALISNVEDPNNGFLMTLQGNISSRTAWEDSVSYLRTKFPNLTINVTTYYIRFADSEFERLCILNYSSDHVGCTTFDISSVNSILNNIFEDNPNLRTVDFSRFGVINNAIGPNLDGNVNLEHLYVKNCQDNVVPNRICCAGNTNMDSIVIWSAKRLVGLRRDDSNSQLRLLAVKTLTEPSTGYPLVDGNTFSKLKVEDFYIGMSTPPTADGAVSNYIGSYDNITHCIYVPIGSASAYRSASIWSDFCHEYQEYNFDTDPDGIFDPVK